MRKLASIQKVLNLEPIPKADRIKKVTILGWELVVQKDQFKVGDLCVYIECDSILPEREEFEFMRERKFRVKTIKLRKQISQGLCFPLSILPEKKYKEGQDVTSILKITKYLTPTEKKEQELMLIKNKRMDKFFKRFKWYRRLLKTRVNFPPFIKKTDETRLQNIPEILDNHKNTFFDVTEKLDGTSLTCFLIKNKKWLRFWKPHIFGVCSRNFQLLRQSNKPYWEMAKKLNIKNKLILAHKELGKSYCIQGEIVGPGVQKNKLKLDEKKLYVFNVFDLDKKKYLNTTRMINFCKIYGFDTVPILYKDFKLKNTIPKMVDFSNGVSVLNDDAIREGIVLRNYEKGISFKAVSPKFLLKYE